MEQSVSTRRKLSTGKMKLLNRDSTVFLLAKIRSKHDADKDITVVLDNAKYNRAKDVIEYASRHKLSFFICLHTPQTLIL